MNFPHTNQWTITGREGGIKSLDVPLHTPGVHLDTPMGSASRASGLIMPEPAGQPYSGGATSAGAKCPGFRCVKVYVFRLYINLELFDIYCVLFDILMMALVLKRLLSIFE